MIYSTTSQEKSAESAFEGHIIANMDTEMEISSDC